MFNLSKLGMVPALGAFALDYEVLAFYEPVRHSWVAPQQTCRQTEVRMLDKFLTESFRKLVKSVISDAKAAMEKRADEDLARDETRIRENLLAPIESYSKTASLEADYLIAAVDGSGSDNFAVMDDIRFHLLSTATVVLNTGTREGRYFQPLDTNLVEEKLGAQPCINMHWHSGVRQDARDKLSESLASIYSDISVEEFVTQFFRDELKRDLKSLSELEGTEYSRHIARLKSMRRLISRSQTLTNPVVHDELRKASEYSAARKVLTSDLHPKFLMLDGAMSIFMHLARKYPSMPSGFMLRDLCRLARQRGVILCAVSKNHTIPFAHRIAYMAKDKFGENTKWFCYLPGREDSGGILHIYEKRTYIPPHLAVPYLFSFSGDNRPSRIDFDRVWWEENILVPNDPAATRANEQSLFRELEFMSRDARWYGYPVALALAHESCKVSYEDLEIAREVCADLFHEIGVDPRTARELREDFSM